MRIDSLQVTQLGVPLALFTAVAAALHPHGVTLRPLASPSNYDRFWSVGEPAWAQHGEQGLYAIVVAKLGLASWEAARREVGCAPIAPRANEVGAIFLELEEEATRIWREYSCTDRPFAVLTMDERQIARACAIERMDSLNRAMEDLVRRNQDRCGELLLRAHCAIE